MKKIFIIGSFGGHWQQLNIIVDAMNIGDAYHFVYCTTKMPEVMNNDIYIVQDSNFSHKRALLKTFFQLFFILIKNKPNVIITTGAAPGLIALFICKILGVKERVWIDSIANVNELSMGGKIAKYVSTKWITQWKPISGDGISKPKYIGRIL